MDDNRERRSAVCIAVVSGKGGTGKSTVCCGLGHALARAGHRVLLVDADAGLRCLDLMLSVSEQLVYDLGDVTAGRCDISDAILPVCDRLGLLAAPYKGEIEPTAFKALTERLREQFDFIFIDSTAGIGSGFSAACAAADRALIVTTPDGVCVRDVGRVSALLSECGIDRHRLIINRFISESAGGNGHRALDDIIDGAASRLIGIVPFDSRLTDGGFTRRGRSRRAFDRIAGRLCGQNIKLPRLNKI